jgi:hypothetical protein
MFYDPLKEQVIDYVEGQTDLARRIIRTIGDPQERFSEDYLRMLRAIRFSTQLGFAIEPATYQAIRRNAASIVRISGERIALNWRNLVRPIGPGRHAARPVWPRLFPGFGAGAGGASRCSRTSRVDLPRSPGTSPVAHRVFGGCGGWPQQNRPASNFCPIAAGRRSEMSPAH